MAAATEPDDSVEDSLSNDSEDETYTGWSHRCPCVSASAKLYRSISQSSGCFIHDRVHAAIHASHSNEGATALSLAYRHLGPKLSLPISACLLNRPLISDVNLSYNSLGEEGGINLVMGVMTNPYITTLDLSGNEFGGTKVSVYLSILLAENNVLMELKLSENRLSDRDAYFLAGGLMENNYLRTLSISNNCIETSGAGYLARGAAINNSLDTIDISGNSIRNEGAIYLGKGITANFMLTEVNASGNGFGYHGALAVRECLQKNNVLRKLDISDNRINWEGALILSHGLEINQTLEVLMIGNNPLTTTGCMDLIDAVGAHCTLNVLDIRNVNVVKSFRQAVMMIQEVNEDFSVVHGVIVNQHDVLGLRLAREVHPMTHIVNYMFDKELRPVELIRMMDKTVSFRMTTYEFWTRCHSLGIEIKAYEREKLLKYITSESKDDIITYVALLSSIEKYIEQEREYRATQRRKLRALTAYQQHLLRNQLPQVSIHSEVNKITEGLLDKLACCKDKQDVMSKHFDVCLKKLKKRQPVPFC